MAIKNLLVTFNGSESSKSALKAAQMMAKKYDAHLTGLLAYDPSPASEYVKNYIPEDMQAEIAEAAERAYDEIGAQFFQEAEKAGLRDRADWIQVAYTPDEAVIEYARYADITLMGQSTTPSAMNACSCTRTSSCWRAAVRC